MKHYIGAYYLIKLIPINFGTIKDSKIYTCSRCINDSFFDYWSLSWTKKDESQLKNIKELFKINDASINEIQVWADKKLNDNKLGWINTFSDLKTLFEYKEKFFSKDTDYQILSVSFAESEINDALDLIKQTDSQLGENGMYNKLKNKEIDNGNNEFLGYDLIGIEIGGDFHSFHCHNLSNELKEKFQLSINEFGLIENCNDWNKLMEFMNDQSNGFEPVPWFYVKVNRIKHKKASA